MKQFIIRLIGMIIKAVFPIRRRSSFEDVQRVLVIGAGGIGDVLMKTPLFEHLKRRFPAAEITLFTSPGPPSLILAGNPFIDRLILVRGREALSKSDLVGLIGCLRSLRKERFDLTITTHYGLSFTGAAFTYLVGAPIRVGFNRRGQGLLYNVRVEVDDPNARHAVQWNLDLVRALGIVATGARTAMYLADDERRFAEELLASRGVGKDSTVISVFPGSKRRTRLWEADRFAGIADALAREYRAKILLIGGPAEEAMIREIEGRMEHAPLVAIGQNIRQTAALIECARLLISTDSGPMHMAAALGTPVVALFGPERPTRVRPFTDLSAVIWHELPCSPCHDFECRFGTRECMRLISADEVLSTIRVNSKAWNLKS